jgi:hypothetical protein
MAALRFFCETGAIRRTLHRTGASARQCIEPPNFIDFCFRSLGSRLRGGMSGSEHQRDRTQLAAENSSPVWRSSPVIIEAFLDARGHSRLTANKLLDLSSGPLSTDNSASQISLPQRIWTYFRN